MHDEGNEPAAETKSTHSNSTLLEAQESTQDVVTAKIPKSEEVWTSSEDKKQVEPKSSADRQSTDRHSTSSSSESTCKSSKSSSSGGDRKTARPTIIEPVESVERRTSLNATDRRISVSSNCDSVCSEKVKTSGSDRSAPSSKPNMPTNDFSLRINKLRFIDESASSTALQSPAESMLHINAHFGSNRGQVFQHTHLNSYNVDRFANKNNASALNGSDGNGSSGRLVNNRLVKIHRQANVRSSSDTWCSDDSKSASQVLSNLSGEMLERKSHASSSTSQNAATAGASSSFLDAKLSNSHALERIMETNQGHLVADQVKKTARNGVSMQQDTEDDEEIKTIIMNNLLQ